MSITLDTLISTVLEANPQNAKVFIQHRMACIGCSISHLHTVAEAAAVYRLNPQDLLTELQRTQNHAAIDTLDD